MTAAAEALNSAIDEVTALRARLAKGGARGQVRGRDQIEAVRRVAQAWFDHHRGKIGPEAGPLAAQVNDAYAALTAKADRSSARSGYLVLLRALRADLISLRTRLLAAETSGTRSAGQVSSPPPDFSSVAADTVMQGILTRRWKEVVACMGAGASLAPVVMMGGILEGLLLARVNQLTDQSPVFTATTAPKDNTGRTLKLRDWTLKDYIAVAHELKWIGESAKDVSVVLRDYRNYIHPTKELAHQMSLTPADTAVMWTVFVTLTDQILKNAAARRA